MPKRRDLRSICVIGSGPIVIGQACEFDYAGSQALKVLRAEGFRTIVVNSNPATIMTDPGFADRTYVEPLDLESVAAVLRRERPDALLPTLGGQTALNLASDLSAAGILDELGVELIGAGFEAIRRAEDRELFRETVRDVGLKVPESVIVTDAEDLPAELHFPAILRPAFTLGGHGGGIVHDRDELEAGLERGLRESPVGQVLVEESLIGWDEFELEVMRDRRDNVVIVCSIENLDPMGVHTGDSVTVAPQMTLSDEAYQELRNAAASVIRAVGVETGGSNIQFARERESGELRVIEMNPRVSRSSALASKATGYPIAKVAAKLAVGYTLDEIPNDLTGTTPASFEPTLDYVVVKFPRFAFEKFPGADETLGTQMKSVGEAMGIGRTFTEAFLKAMRSRELEAGAATPWASLDALPEGVHPWFLAELERAKSALCFTRTKSDLVANDWIRLKSAGWSDREIAIACNTSEEEIRAARVGWGVRPAYRRVDSCAAEVEARSNYLYSTWGEEDEARPAGNSVVILGSGPNRIGQGIEFDYCCVHAAKTFRVARPRGGHGQLQPRDRLDGLRHVRPPLLRTARRGGGARDLRARAAARRRHPVRRADTVEARKSARGRRLRDSRNAVRRGRPRRGPRALCRPLRRARNRRPALGSRCGSGGRDRDRGGDRLPGPRPSVLRPRRAQHAGLLRPGGGRSGGRGRGSRSRRPVPRGGGRDRRRCALRRRADPCCSRDGARRGGRGALRGLLLRPPAALAHPGGARACRGDGSQARARRSGWSGSSMSSSRWSGTSSTSSKRTRAPRAPFLSRARRSG